MPGTPAVRWRLLLDTADEHGFVEQGRTCQGGATHLLTAISVALFEQETGTGDEARSGWARRIAQRVGSFTAAVGAPPATRSPAGTRRNPDPRRVI